MRRATDQRHMLSEFREVLSSRFSEYINRGGVYIGRDADPAEYTSNFGIQWNKFKQTQLDSCSGNHNTEFRLFGCSGWHPSSLRGKLVLEIGSGAGRFTEILLREGALVVSIEPSSAIYANQQNNQDPSLLLIKERLEKLPIKPQSFDYVLCYGVIQHTPNPKQSYQDCIQYVKSNGMCSFDHYQKIRIPSPWYHPKYVWRPLTRRLKPELLLRIIRFYIPLYLPIDTAIRKIPKIGNIISGIIPIPCWNYTGAKEVDQSRESLVEWAVMDTVDALGACYDYPWSLKQLSRFATRLPVKSFHIGVGGNGILLNTYGNTSYQSTEG